MVLLLIWMPSKRALAVALTRLAWQPLCRSCLSSAKMNIGSIIRVASMVSDGSPIILFESEKGLHTPSFSLSRSNLLKVLRSIAAKSADLLAPLKAAASLMNTIHRSRIADPSLKVGLQHS